MRYRVRYWGQIKRAVGSSEETIELDRAPTVGELLRHLVSKHDESFRSQVVGENGEPRASLVVVVDDEQLSLDSQERLDDGVTVTLLPPIAGGLEG